MSIYIALRSDKRASIPKHTPPVLERLAIDPQQWLYTVQHFESRFKGLVGTAYSLKSACRALVYQRCAGIRACREAFG